MGRQVQNEWELTRYNVSQLVVGYNCKSSMGFREMISSFIQESIFASEKLTILRPTIRQYLMTCYLLISIIMFMLLLYEVVTNINNLLALASVPGPCLQYNIYNVHIFYATINSLTVVYFPMLSTFLCTHTSMPMNVFDLCVYPGRCYGSMHYYWKRNHWKYTDDPPLHILVL